MTGFETFGREHLLWLFLLSAAGALVYRCLPDGNRPEAVSPPDGKPRTARRVLLAAALLPVLGRVLPGLYEIRKGSYGLASLPLHVCSMAGYGCLLHFLLTEIYPAGSGKGTARQALSELLFFPGLPGAGLALLFPGWGWCAPFSFLSICEFLGHWGIVLYVLLRIRDGGIRPSPKRAWIPILFCAGYICMMLPFDRMTGMNYGFLLLPAPDSPLSGIAGVAGNGAGYYAGYVLLLLGLMAACYAPFRSRREK
ncbi:MAG: YwaF family protein [Stomatobaculum sp.]|nr:YwaF family protein [Stomatobaculum sp.]